VNYLLYSNGILSYVRYLLCCFVVVLVLLVVFLVVCDMYGSTVDTRSGVPFF